MDFILFILILLIIYMFFRLVCSLHKKGILKDEDIFFITATPCEYKKYKEKYKKNTEGS